MPEISLLNVSIIGTVLILMICILRKIPRISKRTIVRMWSIVILRLLILFALPSFIWIPVSESIIPSSLFSQTERIEESTVQKEPSGKSNVSSEVLTETAAQKNAEQPVNDRSALDQLTIRQKVLFLWGIGVVVGLIGLGICRIVHQVRMQKARDVRSDYIDSWLKNHPLRRMIRVQTAEGISPYTYGAMAPRIVIPEDYKQISYSDLDLVLMHEWCHIRRMDVLRKQLFLLALVLNWYNPMVYLAFHFLREDIEQACDEQVLLERGGKARSEYAMALVHLAEMKNRQTAAGSGFGSFPLKRRIEHIMDTKEVGKWQKRISWLCLILFLSFGCLLSLTGCQSANSTNKKTFSDIEDGLWMIGETTDTVLGSYGIATEEATVDKAGGVWTGIIAKYAGQEFELQLSPYSAQDNRISGYRLVYQIEDPDARTVSCAAMEQVYKELTARYGEPDTYPGVGTSYRNMMGEQGEVQGDEAYDVWDISEDGPEEAPYIQLYIRLEIYDDTHASVVIQYRISRTPAVQ